MHISGLNKEDSAFNKSIETSEHYQCTVPYQPLTLFEKQCSVLNPKLTEVYREMLCINISTKSL